MLAAKSTTTSAASVPAACTICRPASIRLGLQARSPSRGRPRTPGFSVTGYRLELIGYRDQASLPAHPGHQVEAPGGPAVAQALPLRWEREPEMMPPTSGFGALVDTHAHLEDRRLQEDIEGVIERARAAGTGPDHRNRHHGRQQCGRDRDREQPSWHFRRRGSSAQPRRRG